ncbi:stalk domain-containing protein [Paraclostridium sordellii]|uniref:Uncharacterized protein n=1 Tax=Paraclostridium sordellii TaxID=1505 RepID=A0A0C7QLV0_PARSO|nr:stalk domain-containing protein [Paeniclostridium sordellii]CEN79984.1 Uncharacterised protein [[Clostridium] sordellii] [Paeniclostridium sordellii]CEQ04556.1 Uncharacterised protein [[Clostridium] sordellii] [Paeniclostridium sordellii]
MKSRTIIGLTLIGIISTSSIAFANDIKILKKSDVDYIPLKKVIQKSGGKINIEDNTAKVIIDGKSIVIEKNLSFAKLNDDYCPFNTKKINGIEIPVDTKPIFEKDEVYIAKDFLKNYKIVNYKIEKGNVKIISDRNDRDDGDKKTIQNVDEDKKEEKDLDVIDNTNEDLKKSNEISEPKLPEKIEKPVKQEKPTIQISPSEDETKSDNNRVESDKENIKNNIEEPNGETKPENEKTENKINEVPKVEVPNEQQPKEQVE